MNDALCQHLNEYLDRALSAVDEAAFVGHLASCPACRRSVEEEEQVRHLLRCAVAELEPAPEGLAEQVGNRVRSSKRRRIVRLTVGMSAAAAVVVAIGVWHVIGQRGADERISVHQPPTPALGAQLDPRKEVEVVVPQSDNVIAVPLETSRPNVTIVWLYPAVSAPGTGAATDSSNNNSERNEP